MVVLEIFVASNDPPLDDVLEFYRPHLHNSKEISNVDVLLECKHSLAYYQLRQTTAQFFCLLLRKTIDKHEIVQPVLLGLSM